MTHNEDWIQFLPEIYFKSAEAKKNWNITKEQFATDIRHSGTSPYTMDAPSAWRDVSLNEWQESLRGSELEAQKVDGYYIAKYHYGDSPGAHAANLMNPLKVRQLKKSKWLREDGTLYDIEYKTNKQGFRGRHFDDEPGLVCFGDSFTFGVGNTAENTWPAQLSRMLGSKTWNLGIPGVALDAGVYYAQNFMDEDLPNVTGICIMEPTYGITNRVLRRSDPDRLVYQPWHKLYYSNVLTEHMKIRVPEDMREEFMNSLVHTALFQQDIMLNSLKNIAKIKGIPFITVSMTDIKPVDFSRDLMHRGPKSLELVASAMYDKYMHESS